MHTSELFLAERESADRAPRWRDLLLDRAVLWPLLAAALLLGALALGLFTLRGKTLEAEQRTLDTLVAALADQADSALAASQTALEATVDELATGAWLANDDLAEPVLRTRAATLPWVRQLLILDLRGRVVQSAHPQREQPAFAHADYVRVAIGAPRGSAHLGKPERWPGEAAPLLPLSVPWYAADGHQVGVVVLVADLSLLTGSFTRTRPAPDAGLHVLGRQGDVWLSEPAGTAALAGGPTRAQDWLVVEHALRRAPLTLAVTRDRAAVLRDWTQQVDLSVAIAAVVMAATAALALRHVRELRWRESSQARLQAQQARAARAFEAAREGLWEWDPARRHHLLSPRMRELLGFDVAEEVPDGPLLAWPDRVSPQERERLDAALAQPPAEAGQGFSVTLHIDPPGLAARQVRIRGQWVGEAAQGLAHLAGTAYDVTDEVEMAQRARQLDEQLQRARRLEALGTLAGGVAHDFNNVLAAIQGNAERALDQMGADSPARTPIGRVLDATQRGKTLAERLLATGQHGQVAWRSYRPAEVLGEAWALVTQDLPAGVGRSLALHDGGVELQGDPVAFFEACLNLLRNAAQALQGRGSLQATLELESVDAERMLWHGRLGPGRWLRLDVVDDGPGIGAEHLPYLLDPFFTTRAGRGGTGLGMTVVHNTVRDAGGALDLRTAPGEGTAFALYMPLSPGLAPSPPLADARGGGQVVLAAEDEPELAALLEESLAGLGYEPRVFTDPEAALRAFAAEPALFDVLLTDQLMPGMDGLSLLAHCRRLAPALPCVVLTGFGGPDFSQRAAAARVDAVLAKPLSTPALGQALAAVLASAPGRG